MVDLFRGSAIQPGGVVNVARFPRTVPGSLLREVREPSSPALRATPSPNALGEGALSPKVFSCVHGHRGARCPRRQVHRCISGRRRKPSTHFLSSGGSTPAATNLGHWIRSHPFRGWICSGAAVCVRPRSIGLSGSRRHHRAPASQPSQEGRLLVQVRRGRHSAEKSTPQPVDAQCRVRLQPSRARPSSPPLPQRHWSATGGDGRRESSPQRPRHSEWRIVTATP